MVPNVVQLEWRNRVDEVLAAQARALLEAALAADGVWPVSDHVRLRLRHGEPTDPSAAAEPEPTSDGAHLLALDAMGQLAGYAHLEEPADGPAVAELVVHPLLRRRGMGAALVEKLIGRVSADPRVAPSADRLLVWAHGEHPAALRLARRYGFRRARELWRMRCDLDRPGVGADPLAVPKLPDGVRLRPFRVGQDEAAFVEVNNRAFSWHPEQGRWDVREVELREAEPWFDPEGFLLAVDEQDRILGFHWTKVHEAEGDQGGAPIGEVYVLGVDPDEHGRGLGRALTQAGLRYLHSRGLNRVMLYVEATNAGAIALYARMGFQRWDVDVQFAW